MPRSHRPPRLPPRRGERRKQRGGYGGPERRRGPRRADDLRGASPWLGRLAPTLARFALAVALGFFAAWMLASAPGAASKRPVRATAAARPDATLPRPPTLDLPSPTDVVIFEAAADAARAQLAACAPAAGCAVPSPAWAHPTAILP